jgi:glutamate 5-kinase
LGGETAGALVINDGAIEALERQKASLLPVGVVCVEGEFSQGSLVELRDTHGRVRGRGLTNYGGDACRLIAGLQSEDIAARLGWKGYDALITRDNLVMGER